jgi:multiple sugar transport system substrate-binding protein
VYAVDTERYGRRDFLRLGAAAAAGVAATGYALRTGAPIVRAAEPEASAPSGTLSVAIWGDTVDYKTLHTAINKYMTLYPAVKVTVREGNCGADYAACKTLIAGGTMPDVFVPGIWNYNAMVDAGVLTDLTPYMKSGDFNLGDYNSTITGQMKSLKDGHLYGLPMGFNIQSIFYNKDMFDKAKLAYPPMDGNYTWNDLRAWAKKLTLDANGNTPASSHFNARKVKQWGFFTWAMIEQQAHLDSILLAHGGSLMTYPSRQRCNLENPNTIKGLQFIQDLMWKDRSTLTPQANQEEFGVDRFVAGHVAMEQGSHEQVGLVAARNPSMRLGIAPLPKGPYGAADCIQIHIWSIFNRAQNKDLAWHFVKWISGPGSGTEMGLVPHYKDYAYGPDFLKGRGEPAGLKQAQLDPLKWKLTIVPTSFNQKNDGIAGQDGFGPALTNIMANKQTAADAVRGVSQKVNAIMQQ